MKNKTLALIALLGAPAMLVGTVLEHHYPALKDSWFTTVWGLLYITPWLFGSLVCMQRMEITGPSSFGRILLKVLMVTLIVADISNLLWMVYPGEKPAHFFFLDMFWPLSHLLMLPVGVMAIQARRLAGWKRFVPLLQGLWLPLALGSLAVFGRTDAVMFLGGLYNAATWILMALVLYRESVKEEASILVSGTYPRSLIKG